MSKRSNSKNSETNHKASLRHLMDLPTPNMMKIWQFQSGIVCHNRLGDRDHHHKCWGEDIVTTQIDPNPPDIVHKNNLLLPFQFEKHACDRPKRHPNVFYLVLRTEEPNKIYWSNWTIHMIQMFQIWSNYPQERSNPVRKKNPCQIGSFFQDFST